VLIESQRTGLLLATRLAGYLSVSIPTGDWLIRVHECRLSQPLMVSVLPAPNHCIQPGAALAALGVMEQAQVN
jgi:hypothetical protein